MDLEKARKRVEIAAKTGFAVGLIAEAEKTLLARTVRENIPDVLLPPFIYTSDLAVAIPAGYIAMRVGGYIMEGIVRWGEYSRRVQKLAGFLGGISLAILPISVGVQFEMLDKCESVKSEVNSCAPDPIDAGSVVVGGALGVALASLTPPRKGQEVTVAGQD